MSGQSDHDQVHHQAQRTRISMAARGGGQRSMKRSRHQGESVRWWRMRNGRVSREDVETDPREAEGAGSDFGEHAFGRQ